MTEAALTRLLRLRVQSPVMLIIPVMDRCCEIAEIFRKAAGRHGEWPIDRLSQGVFEILGEAYIHENDWRACFTKCVCKLAANPRDLVCPVRRQFMSDYAFLQIDEDQCGRLGIEFKHGFSPVGLTFGVSAALIESALT